LSSVDYCFFFIVFSFAFWCRCTPTDALLPLLL